MLKCYEKNDYEVFEYEFSGIGEFLRYLDKAPINDSFTKYQSQDGDYDFTGTNSYKEAVEMCKFGCNENFEYFVKIKNSVERYLKLENNKNKQNKDFIGYAPDVKSFLEGDPLNMINSVRPKRKKISIYYNIAYPCFTSSNQILNMGTITLALIDTLEKMNYNVDLNIFEMSVKNKQVFISKYIFKLENERSNLKKLYFPMCHPSFLRRLNFRLKEKTLGLRPEWNSGYGSHCSTGAIKNNFDLEDNNIIISNPTEMHIYGDDILNDTYNMFEMIDKNNNNAKVLTLIPSGKNKRR